MTLPGDEMHSGTGKWDTLAPNFCRHAKLSDKKPERKAV